ncbi:uncharacterized protein ATC70_004253 [Mucor velutinosus]|uniref:Postreplication repair E3 ubiquitin-protein ligase RAD18 n=1 Tax=Mucor velutinosus TaxID=708070 RepID=A0AAN7HQT2_9FUNG|nr:hypothetical protein ATC70_004253 [Mucor velutinosus]
MSAGNMEDGFDDPSDFNATQLSTLDEHLRCPICKEIFDATMLLSTCSHSFCALCIRRSLSTEQICPKCRKPAYESNLIHNYDLDNVVRQWRESRQFLIALERAATAPNQDIAIHSAPASLDNDFSNDAMRTINSGSPTASPSHIPSPSTRRSTRLSSQSITSASPQGSPMQMSQPDTNRVDIIAPTQSHQTLSSVQADSSSPAECPICWKQMDVRVIQAHVDACLNGDSRIPPLPKKSSTPAAGSSKDASFPFIASSHSSTYASSSSMARVSNTLKTKSKPVNLGKKPIKQVYNLMTDKALNALLRSFNLSDSGDRATKIWRHKEYLNLYNANQDSHRPVSANVLVQRLQAIENSRAIQSKRKATDPEEHKAMYADQFQSLINHVKRKKGDDANASSQSKN